MRFITKISIPNQKGNAALKDGSLPRIVQQALETWKPEGAYFTTVDGERTAFLIVDLPETSSMPSFAEPFFTGLDAKVEFFPAMNAADLREGISKLPSR